MAASPNNKLRHLVEQAEKQAGLSWSLYPHMEICETVSPFRGKAAAALVAAHLYLRLAADLRRVSSDPIFSWDNSSNRARENFLGERLRRMVVQLHRQHVELPPLLCAYDQSPFIQAFLRHFWRSATPLSIGRLREIDCEALQDALTTCLTWAEDAARRKKQKLFYNDARKAGLSVSAYLQSLRATGPLSVIGVRLTAEPTCRDLYLGITPLVIQLFEPTDFVDQEAHAKLLDREVFKKYSVQLKSFLGTLKRDLGQTFVGYSIKQEFRLGIGAYFMAFLFFDGKNWTDFDVLRDVVQHLWIAVTNVNLATAGENEVVRLTGRWSISPDQGSKWDAVGRMILASQVDITNYLNIRMPTRVRSYRRGTIRGEG